MAHKSRARRREKAVPATDTVPALAKPRRNYARWRALTLSLVYVVFAIHIIHWKVSGKTLAPLELNEVMYTLELGVITAGFLFMCTLVLGTAVFGRFFCSWACHIMVLQDLCAWILRKFGIRQKQIRSRLLLLVPPLTAFYMFIWPQIVRAYQSRAFPEFHMRTDAQGWASFTTDNFWRNLPNAPIIVLTFLVCGFGIVYLLGSRTFCTYVCPYGAIFALADRFSPGRIVVSDACQQCGTCTAACTSGVRVHEEVKKHGMIVNPACLKDFDCIANCPQEALHYTFSKPALFRSRKSGGRFGLPYQFSIAEEVLMGFVFVVVLLSFRGLYSRIPFLLSLALGAVFGYFSVIAVRLFNRPSVQISKLQLKDRGRLAAGAYVYLALCLSLAALVGHSAVIRYHEYTGLRQSRVVAGVPPGAEGDSLAVTALAHLARADAWGLVHNERVERRLVDLSARLREFADVRMYAARVLKRRPNDIGIHLQYGRSLLAENRLDEAERGFRVVIGAYDDSVMGRTAHQLASVHQSLGELLIRRGDFAGAATQMRAGLRLDPNRAALHAALGGVLAELRRFDEAIGAMERAVALQPELAAVHYNLGTILGRLNRYDEAIPHYERALDVTPDDADLHNNLGFALWQTGASERANASFVRALEIDPGHAKARLNLSRLRGL